MECIILPKTVSKRGDLLEFILSKLLNDVYLEGCKQPRSTDNLEKMIHNSSMNHVSPCHGHSMIFHVLRSALYDVPLITEKNMEFFKKIQGSLKSRSLELEL